jgi:hypothetical protein
LALAALSSAASTFARTPSASTEDDSTGHNPLIDSRAAVKISLLSIGRGSHSSSRSSIAVCGSGKMIALVGASCGCPTFPRDIPSVPPSSMPGLALSCRLSFVGGCTASNGPAGRESFLSACSELQMRNDLRSLLNVKSKSAISLSRRRQICCPLCVAIVSVFCNFYCLDSFTKCAPEPMS